MVWELALVLPAVLHTGVAQFQNPDLGAGLVDGVEAGVGRVEDVADGQDLQVGGADPRNLQRNITMTEKITTPS